MEVMTNIAQRKVKCASITFRKLFIFVTSIARTNLEAEIIQRGGSLCSANATRYKPKRDCIVEVNRAIGGGEVSIPLQLNNEMVNYDIVRS